MANGDRQSDVERLLTKFYFSCCKSFTTVKVKEKLVRGRERSGPKKAKGEHDVKVF